MAKYIKVKAADSDTDAVQTKFRKLFKDSGITKRGTVFAFKRYLAQTDKWDQDLAQRMIDKLRKGKLSGQMTSYEPQFDTTRGGNQRG